MPPVSVLLFDAFSTMVLACLLEPLRVGLPVHGEHVVESFALRQTRRGSIQPDFRRRRCR
jgi:hypothetical protein